MDNLFLKIISLENLLDSWEEFRCSKRKKENVQLFERHLENNLFKLHGELKNKTYTHYHYTSFFITDPKLRHIHKAIVRDRIVHHVIHRILYPIFDRSFIFDSYSCRIDKGTHRAVRRLETFTRKVSKNYTKSCFVLKCDVKKFFDSVDHGVLKRLIRRKIKDTDVLNLIDQIIDSFGEHRGYKNNSQMALGFLTPKGMPIGNLTSQLFANIYLNELDRFVKNTLKVKYYIRYCDDFVILSNDEKELVEHKLKLEKFVKTKLGLNLHKDKVSIRRLTQGIDFLGYIIMPHFSVLRTKTKKRMMKRIAEKNLSSYLGLLSHCNSYGLEKKIKEMVDDSKKK